MRAWVEPWPHIIWASSYTNHSDTLKASFVVIDTSNIHDHSAHADNQSLVYQNSNEKYLNHPINIGFGPAVRCFAGQLKRFSFFYGFCHRGLLFEVVQNGLAHEHWVWGSCSMCVFSKAHILTWNVKTLEAADFFVFWQYQINSKSERTRGGDTRGGSVKNVNTRHVLMGPGISRDRRVLSSD